LDVVCEDFIWVSEFGLVVRGTLARVEEDGVEGGNAGVLGIGGEEGKN
jgi:hypothetical protein